MSIYLEVRVVCDRCGTSRSKIEAQSFFNTLYRTRLPEDWAVTTFGGCERVLCPKCLASNIKHRAR